MSVQRLGRIAREALLLLRRFLEQGDRERAARAALQAAEAFSGIAKHSTGASHRAAYQRAKLLVEVTKILRRDEPLPPEVASALESLYPTTAPPSPPSAPLHLDEAATAEMREEGREEERVEEGGPQREILSGLDISRRLISMLDRASHSIRIMVQSLTDVKEVAMGDESVEVNLLERLASKAEEGVVVRLIIRDPESLGGAGLHFRQAVEKLLSLSSRVEVLVCAQMHIKAIIVDEVEVMEGSPNFTVKGLSGLGEQASWTNDPSFVAQFVERFDRYWIHQSRECTSCKNRTCEVHPLTRRWRGGEGPEDR